MVARRYGYLVDTDVSWELLSLELREQGNIRCNVVDFGLAGRRALCRGFHTHIRRLSLWKHPKNKESD
jgi:hypothetical protein